MFLPIISLKIIIPLNTRKITHKLYHLNNLVKNGGKPTIENAQ